MGCYKISENVMSFDDISYLMAVSTVTHEEALKELVEHEMKEDQNPF